MKLFGILYLFYCLTCASFGHCQRTDSTFQIYDNVNHYSMVFPNNWKPFKAVTNRVARFDGDIVINGPDVGGSSILIPQVSISSKKGSFLYKTANADINERLKDCNQSLNGKDCGYVIHFVEKLKFGKHKAIRYRITEDFMGASMSLNLVYIMRKGNIIIMHLYWPTQYVFLEDIIERVLFSIKFD